MKPTNLIKFLVSYLSIFTINSCTKEVPFETSIEKKIVLNSIFSNDSELSLNIGNSCTMNESLNGLSDSFSIRILENERLIFDSIVQTGKINTHILVNTGQKYILNVQSEKYGEITAIDSLPKRINIAKAELLFPVTIDEYGSYWGEAKITFNDPEDEVNYYELLVYSENKEFWNNFNDYPVTDPVILNEGDLDYSPTSLFFSDELINGQTYEMSIKGTAGVSVNSDGVKPLHKHFAELRSISKNYYLYRKYYTRHKNNQQIPDKDFYDYVYPGEPIDMFSNIDNGYGIFAGYQSSIQQLSY